MLQKIPKKSSSNSWLRLGAKLTGVAVAVELACLGGSYFFWRKLNTQQDFRQKCYDSYPIVLETYYKVGEFFDSEKTAQIRQLDLELFSKRKTKSEK